MAFRSLASVALLASFFPLSSAAGAAQAPTLVCQPAVTPPIIVATHDQIVEGGRKAEPPLTDTKGFGFAWPDTQMGVIKTADGYEWFTSDGAFHPRQIWQGQWVGNNNYGSVVTTVGTLDNPLGTGAPQDVTISPNPDPAVNPNYPSYTYIGGGPVYQVPEGKIGAGNLLVGYHAELPSNCRPTASISIFIFPTGLPGPHRLRMSQWRAHWFLPCWTPRLDRDARTLSLSRSSTKGTGICNPGSVELPPISIRNGRRNREGILISTSTARLSAT